MKAKILILGLVCLFVFTYCESPASPEKALNPEPPDPTPDISYSYEFELSVSYDVSATGDIYLFREEIPKELNVVHMLPKLDFFPLPDNPDVSEGMVSCWQELFPGTYKIIFRLAHYNDYEEGQNQITPGEWVIKMIAASPDIRTYVAGGIQEQRIGLWKVGQDYEFTFSVSD